MKKLVMIAMLAGFSTPANAQEVSELVGALQTNGYISLAQIREMRGKQFDTLDKDKSGGLSQDEAQGALSIAGRRGGQGGGGGMAGGRMGGGAGAGGAANMTEEQRKAMRERMQQRQREGGQGGGMGGGRRGQRGAGGGAGGPGAALGQMQFMAADGDFDGQLTRAEFVEAPIPTLVGADKDMDGRISVEEIQAMQAQQRSAMGQMGGNMMPE
jgi:hypothetical protein